MASNFSVLDTMRYPLALCSPNCPLPTTPFTIPILSLSPVTAGCADPGHLGARLRASSIPERSGKSLHRGTSHTTSGPAGSFGRADHRSPFRRGRLGANPDEPQPAAPRMARPMSMRPDEDGEASSAGSPRMRSAHRLLPTTPRSLDERLRFHGQRLACTRRT